MKYFHTSNYMHNSCHIITPAECRKEVLPELDEMIGFKETISDIIECGLSLVNPALHLGPFILNLGPIGKWTQNFFLYEQGFTPSAMKVYVALDS